jgi:ketosteroid isomerase-like protein
MQPLTIAALLHARIPSMSTPAQNLEAIRRYLGTLESGSFEAISNLFTAEMTIEQMPNRVYPQGVQSRMRQMAEAFAKGRKLFAHQTYEIKSAVATVDAVAVEVFWTGTLAASFGGLSQGAQMCAHSAMFFEFKNGKIASQRNYDCFEPF